MKTRVEEVLKLIRPKLAIHRGSVELVNVDEEQGIVRVRLTGACDNCPMAGITLKHGIEAILIDTIPEIREVLAV